MFIKFIQPYLARLLSSQSALQSKHKFWQYKQKLTSKPPVVECYLKVDDPYSFLLVQALPELASRYRINWDVFVISELQSEMYPDLNLWQKNAIKDARLLADLYQMAKPSETYLTEGTLTQVMSQLLNWQQTQNPEQQDWSQLLDIFFQVWRPSSRSEQRSESHLSQQQQRLLRTNEQRLKTKKHYLPATLWFQGEWYWGLDRLDHLEHRLNALTLSKLPETVFYQRTYSGFCSSPKQQSTMSKQMPITFYFSMRSPYSYLALLRIKQLADHYRLPLEIKPVLPMVMRGLSVPSTKKFYIFHDTKREAEKLSIDYGFVADPLGAGVVNCYALFEFAKQRDKEVAFLINYATAVNAKGIHSDTESGLKWILEQTGLHWGDAKQALQQQADNPSWQVWAETNRQELTALGYWGVPVTQFADTVVWGQDRLVFIEQAIQREMNARP